MKQGVPEADPATVKYWVYVNSEVPGSFEPSELARIRDFSDASMVCPAEGGVADRNWQRAGLFPDIVKALEERASRRPPPGPPHPADYISELGPFPLDPEEILSGTSERLFNHVTELMKELEHRRDESALAQTLERSLAQTKNELLAARDRIRFLEDQASLIPGYEDREQRLQEFLSRAKADVKGRDAAVADLKKTLDDARRQLGESRRKAEETAAENKNLERWAGDLNRRLADKELDLAKALAVLQRLDQQMHLLTLPGRGASPEPPRLAAPAPVVEPKRSPVQELKDASAPENLDPAARKHPNPISPGLSTAVDPAPPRDVDSTAGPPNLDSPAGPAWLRWAARLRRRLFPR